MLVVYVYVTVLMGLLNVCGNPFIYATKYDVVKKKLKKLVLRGQVSPSGGQASNDKRSSKK